MKEGIYEQNKRVQLGSGNIRIHDFLSISLGPTLETRDHQPPSNSICSVEKQISNENTHSSTKHIAQPSLLCVLTRVFHEINNRKLLDLNFLAKKTLRDISYLICWLGWVLGYKNRDDNGTDMSWIYSVLNLDS